jgi:queuine tRNA-ribosyltransferase
MTAIRFDIQTRSSSCSARLGRVTTRHGVFDTPAFMPVGTAAAMKGLTPAQTRGTGTQIILNNAYHLMLRPGSDVVRRFGGSHRFMRWDGPILTDSGGYQAFSMADINAISEDGVTFRSFIDGSTVHLSPERSIEVQNDIGADIIMAFDDCPPAAPDVKDEAVYRQRVIASHERTLRWLERSMRAHRRMDEQALFGIVQGGTDLELRARSAAEVCATGLEGYAIGGVAVGEGPDMIRHVVEFTAPLLPAERPRYLMGVGYERDIVMAVRAGVDMFDCVLPTRNGRNATAFTRAGRIKLRNAAHRESGEPIEAGCDCEACAGGFGRGYIRHLFMAEEMLGPTLVSLHNVRHFQRLLLDIRRAIRDDVWSALSRDWPVLSDTSPLADETTRRPDAVESRAEPI